MEESPAVRAMYRAGEKARRNGTANMTLEEIDAEIDIVRTARLERKRIAVEMEQRHEIQEREAE